MNVAIGDKGIVLRPTINHCLLKPIFLPYRELEVIGKERIFYQKELYIKFLVKIFILEYSASY